MAVDKNSRAYNSLLNKGYTDAQIMQMHDTASKQGTTKGIITPTYDPMADLTPEYIANMDMNKQIRGANQSFNKYGDDSSRDRQSTRGGLYNKYTGEGVRTSDINYNPNLTTSGLNPNFVYGKQSQVYGTDHPGYISQRNDDIASALYNEGLRSREDVSNFLMKQNGFMNSTQEDRLNTIESVWKRIGDIVEQNNKDNTEIEVKEMEAEKKEEPKGKNVDVNTFLQGSSTELFGKMITGADTAPYDHNSNEWMKAEARLAQYQKINALTVPQLASSIKAGSILSGGQAMRDLQTYNPEKYQQLQEYQKKEDTMATVNMMASGNFTDTQQGLQDKTGESINNYLNETVANAGGDAVSRMDLDTALSQNQGLINYAERMSYYASQINQLDQTIGDLAEDARRRLSAKTGENVPEYMIQNYINNRSKKLYKQRDNLLNQYNYYKGVYEAQIEQEATEWERAYKERQMQLQEDKFAWDKKMDQAGMDYKYDALYSDSIKGTGQGKMRTERNNNPTAMTTDVAKSLGMIEGVDYVQGDAFKTKDGKILYTAKLIGDPIETTIRAFDNAVANGKNIFYTSKGGQRWSHTAMTNDQWSKLTKEQKRNVVLSMLQKEGGDITKFTYYNDGSSNKSSSSSSKKEEKTYTNDENLTRLMQGKISYSDFVKNRQGDEFADEIEKYVGTKYFEKKPLMFMSDLKDAIDDLAKIFNQNPSGGTEEERQNAQSEATQKAELYTLDYLSTSKISNKAIMKQVKKYLDDKGASDDDVITYLSFALAGRYKKGEKDKLDNDLDVIGYKDKWYTKSKANKIWKIWEEDGII